MDPGTTHELTWMVTRDLAAGASAVGTGTVTVWCRASAHSGVAGSAPGSTSAHLTSPAESAGPSAAPVASSTAGGVSSVASRAVSDARSAA